MSTRRMRPAHSEGPDARLHALTSCGADGRHRRRALEARAPRQLYPNALSVSVDVFFDGDGRFITAILRPAKRPSGKETPTETVGVFSLCFRPSGCPRRSAWSARRSFAA